MKIILCQKKIVNTKITFIPLWIQINRILSYSLEVCRNDELGKIRAGSDSCSRTSFRIRFDAHSSPRTGHRVSSAILGRDRFGTRFVISFKTSRTFSNDSKQYRLIILNLKFLFLHTSNIRSMQFIYFSLSLCYPWRVFWLC